MAFAEKISAVLRAFAAPEDRLILAISGGPDSTALLHAMMEWSVFSKLIVAHVNHGLRGADSDADEMFVRNLAKSYGLTCEVKRVKITGSSCIEERGRELRRTFFEKLLKKYHATWIVTAHTADDQLETILMNFLRGCGPNGLAGMKISEGAYLKPMLGISKPEILAYLKSRRLPFCKDKTNEKTQFRRNFIRKKLLPLLAEINPSFAKTWLRNSEMFGELDRWVREEATVFLRKHNSMNLAMSHLANSSGNLTALFSLAQYRVLPKPLQCAVIQESYRAFKKSHYRLPYTKVLEIARLLERGIGNKKIRCGGGGTFVLKKGEVFLQKA